MNNNSRKMVNKTVIRLDLNGCDNCKKIALQSVTKIEGIHSLSMEDRTLTVIGEADPGFVAKKLRRKFQCVEIVSDEPMSSLPQEEKPTKPTATPVAPKSEPWKPEPLPPLQTEIKWGALPPPPLHIKINWGQPPPTPSLSPTSSLSEPKPNPRVGWKEEKEEEEKKPKEEKKEEKLKEEKKEEEKPKEEERKEEPQPESGISSSSPTDPEKKVPPEQPTNQLANYAEELS